MCYSKRGPTLRPRVGFEACATVKGTQNYYREWGPTGLSAPVSAPSGNQGGVGRPVHRAHPSGVAGENAEAVAARRVPDARGVVGARGDHLGAVRAVHHAGDVVFVALAPHNWTSETSIRRPGRPRAKKWGSVRVVWRREEASVSLLSRDGSGSGPVVERRLREREPTTP